MEVYLVYYMEAYEVNEVIGVFGDYVKAREFELDYCNKNGIKEDSYGWCVIRKVEVDKVYDDVFAGIGEEV